MSMNLIKCESSLHPSAWLIRILINCRLLSLFFFMRCSIHPSARQAGMPRLSMSNLLSSANLCSLDALSPVLDAVVVVRPSDQELMSALVLVLMQRLQRKG